MGTYSDLRKKQPSQPEVPSERNERVQRNERDERPTLANPSKQESERDIKRKSYDLFVDQIKTLETKTKVHFLMKGESKTVTDMVREAIDEYIKKHQ